MKRSERKKETFLLTNENMNEAAKRLSKELEEYGRKEDRLRIRLAFEDILDTWQRTLGEETACTIQYGKKRFGGWSVHLAAAGSMSDPNSDSSSTDLEIAGNAILQCLGIYPAFEYKNGTNHLELSLPKEKPNQLFYLLGAAFIAVVLGLCRSNSPGGLNLAFIDPIAKILLDMLMGILSGVAMPMIFLSISISIVNMGNISALGRIGKKFLIRFMVFAFAAPLLTILFYLFTVTISTGNTEIGQFKAMFSMIINIVPTNIIAPFIEGNTLQIIFLGFCVGVAILLLSGRMQTLTDCMKQLQSVTTVFMDGINRLLPVFVFLIVYPIIASGSVSKLGDAIQILVMALVAMVVLAIGATVYFCLRMRVSARIAIQKLWPTFAVALSTASSMACFSMQIECCEKDFGLDEQITRFSIPLAQALLKPEAGMTFAISAMCVASSYDVAITPMWLLMCGLVSALLSIAAPPVPGGGQITYAALFLQLGIPAEGLMLAIMVGTILDFACTAVCSYVNVLLIVLTGDRLNMVDKNILRSAGSSRVL